METTIKVDRGTVWADDSGGDLPPLVLLHPGVGDSRIWDPVLATLVASHRVIRYDARGYGRSPAPTAPYTLADDLVAVLDHYGLARVPVVGCSQGGGSALALAVTRPARVSALVLLCPGIPGYPEPDDPEPDEAEPDEAEPDAGSDRAAPPDVDTVAAAAPRMWAAAGPTPAVMEQLRSAARAWISQGDLERPDPPVFDRLGEIGVPTTLLVGDLDHAPLIDSNRRAAALIPGCEFVEVPGADHMMPLRVPDLVLAAIDRTLARTAAT